MVKKKTIKTLYDELKQKDKIIDKLKAENKVLIKTALKATERLKKLENHFLP